MQNFQGIIFYKLEHKGKFLNSHSRTFNGLILTKDNKEEYIAFVGNTIHADLPHKTEQPKLHKLVTTYQLYRYSKTRHEYKKQSYGNQFGGFFSKRTILAEPLPSIMSRMTNLSQQTFQRRFNVVFRLI